MERVYLRGEIYFADLDPVIGSEQGGIRPVLILQNDMGNRYSSTVIAAAVTSRVEIGRHLPTHSPIGIVGKMRYPSVVLLEQIRTLDKQRLRERVGYLSREKMRDVERALRISFSIR